MISRNIVLNIRNWLMRETPKLAVNSELNGSVAVGTDLGAIREDNQDKVVFAQLKNKDRTSYIGVLADGMGGMSDGAQCASLAISVFISTCYENSNTPLVNRIKLATKNANMEVYKKYNKFGGATLSAFLIENKQIVFVNIGDSRIYLVRTKKLEQLSIDDTLAAQLKRPDLDKNSPLLQYIGMGEGLEPHVFINEVVDFNHRIILTSDGLHHLEERQLLALFSQNGTLSELCRRTLYISNWLDGSDNTSILVANNIETVFNNFISEGITLIDPSGNLSIICEDELGIGNMSKLDSLLESKSKSSITSDPIIKSNKVKGKKVSEKNIQLGILYDDPK